MRWAIGLAVLMLAGGAWAADKSVTLRVLGWHSKGDAYKTEDAVRLVKGVKSAVANSARKELAVVFDDAVATQAQVESAVVSAGYQIGR
jgi:copper chaperone CopZ